MLLSPIIGGGNTLLTTHLRFFWFEHHTDSFITRATLASSGISCRGVSV